MEAIYEVHIGMNRTDYASKDEAIKAIEAAGAGYVVKFIKDFDGRERSVTMDVYADGKWSSPYIHG